MTPGFTVLQDPKDKTYWFVMHNFKLTTKKFRSKTAATIYLNMLLNGVATPEYKDHDAANKRPYSR
jgi:hypothetical protein